MALVKDNAIILSTRSFGESDKIVRFLSLGSGKLSGIAKGAKKSQKRFMNTLESFNRVRIEYFEKATNSLVRIENADIEESNNGLEISLKRVCVASFFTEFVDKFTKEKQRNEQLFHTLRKILESLKLVEFTAIDILYYELQMLRHLGYMLNLTACVHCGKRVPDMEKLYFSKERGGTLCPGCSRSIPHRQYPQGFIPHMQTLNDNSRDSNGAWTQDPSLTAFTQMGTKVLEDFVAYHLAVELKSYRLLKNFTG
jgi:DNA repair protein RecO (recombination protein O)